ncbi:MAG: TVP38/TMEM64 family protein [Candidatus Entotheonellia bacterium]
MLSFPGLDKRVPGDNSSILWGTAKSIGGIVALLVAVVIMGLIVQRNIDVDALRVAIEGWGVLAPLIFMALLAFRNLLFLPVVPYLFLIGLGALSFGNLYGALYFWLGTTAGACVAFFVARYCVGEFAARLKRGRLRTLDQLVSTNGFLAILGLRLVLFSNIWLNYGSGMTSMTLKDFVLGTLIGLTPRTFTLAYIFEGVQEPDMLAAMLSYPRLGVLSLLLGSKIVGVVLLASIARQGRWRAQAALVDASR